MNQRITPFIAKTAISVFVPKRIFSNKRKGEEMKDRLIGLIKKMPWRIEQEGLGGPRISNADKLAEYLLANGVIVPPCKVGDTVYVLATKHPCYACGFSGEFCHKDCRIKDRTKLVVKKATVCSIYVREDVQEIHVEFEPSELLRKYMSTCYFDDFGKIVFPTKEKAEQALKERSEK